MLTSFMQILKDISRGVPTAYGDLVSLLETSSSQLEETFTSLPKFLQKLIKSLPAKLEPGLLRVIATASPAVAKERGLKAIVSSPGMLLSLLKGIVDLLKTRFPMIVGGSAAMSMGLFGELTPVWIEGLG